MPELAAIYVLGLVACLLLTMLFVFLWSQRFNDQQHRTVRENLKRAQLYWSENLDKVVVWEDGAEQRDRATSLRNICLTGGLLSALSWAGVFFLLVIMLSYRFLARSRTEQKIFSSPLSSKSEMDSNDVLLLLRSLDAYRD